MRVAYDVTVSTLRNQQTPGGDRPRPAGKAAIHFRSRRSEQRLAKCSWRSGLRERPVLRSDFRGTARSRAEGVEQVSSIRKRVRIRIHAFMLRRKSHWPPKFLTMRRGNRQHASTLIFQGFRILESARAATSSSGHRDTVQRTKDAGTRARCREAKNPRLDVCRSRSRRNGIGETKSSERRRCPSRSPGFDRSR